MLYGLWCLGSGLFFLIFLWLLKIEPYVRRRNRTSTFFLYPWAPWKDYLDAVKTARRHRHGTPFFSHFVFLGEPGRGGGYYKLGLLLGNLVRNFFNCFSHRIDWHPMQNASREK